MSKKITLLILLVLAAIIATVLILGYRVWNKPHQDIYLAPSVMMTSVELYSYLSNNDVEKSSWLINKVQGGKFVRISPSPAKGFICAKSSYFPPVS